MSKKVAIFLATGFEEAEAVIIIDILRRAKIEVDVFSITKEKVIAGGHNIKIETNKLLDEINGDDYQMLILPGGMKGVNNLKKSTQLKQLFEEFYKKFKYLAAICAAPQILFEWNLLNNKNITVYPECLESNNQFKIIKEAPVVIDNNIITGASMGCAIKFTLELVKILVNDDIAKEIAKQLVIW